MIKYEHIAKSFAGQQVLQDVSFTVDKGELFVLVGPSGSGKTTLLKMFNRLMVPDDGNVYFNNKKIKDYDLQDLRLHTGYVLQDSSLFPNLNIEDNISIQLEQQGVSKSERHAIARDLLTKVDLDESYAQRMPNELSGGEQQRVGIVRALAAKPSVILMDESFSALDPVVRKQLQDLVLKIHQQNDTTVLFVTHDMREALRMGDKIAVLKDGVLQQVGRPNDIILHPANDFVRNFFKGHGIQPDFTSLVQDVLGQAVDVANESSIVEMHSLAELLSYFRDHDEDQVTCRLSNGDFVIEQNAVWNYLIRKENENA